MAHVDAHLTRNIEIGAVRIDSQDGLEIVKTDGMKEVRNSRTDAEPRSWEVSLPTASTEGDTSDYDSVRQMWRDTLRGLHTFNFHCFIDDETVMARFASPLQITAPAGHLRHIDTFTLLEVTE